MQQCVVEVSILMDGVRQTEVRYAGERGLAPLFQDPNTHFPVPYEFYFPFKVSVHSD